MKSLVQVPAVLAMMAEQLEWTQKLGDAVLAQQPDVMDAIQRLRASAQANGKLKTTKEQTVTVQTEGEKQYVAIEPTSPNEIYVPYYEPAVVYGDWPYPDYAPYYFPPPSGYSPGAALATGIAFAGGRRRAPCLLGQLRLGRPQHQRCSTRTSTSAISTATTADNSNWQHNADHRHGVKYNNADVRQKFAKNDIQAGKGARQDFRGKDGQQVLDPGNGPVAATVPVRVATAQVTGPGAGDRPGAR